MESFKSKQSGDSGICLKAPQSDDDAAAASALSVVSDGLVMKPTTTLPDEFDETVNSTFFLQFQPKFKPLPNSTSSLKDKLKNASSLIKKLSDNQFTTAKKSQLPRGTSQPDLLADLGVERFTLSPF